MRLTLRTLLAYLDNILLPEDRADIGAKVRDSEFATALEGRIRDVNSRVRLGAPQVVGAGMGRDPNSVAEYLDNTLAPEQVQLFEKVCLESDVHLAEVGSCHHICAMILGEPAQVDPASRERMYRLIEATLERTADEAILAQKSPAVSAPQQSAAAMAVGAGISAKQDGAAPEAAMMDRQKPEVPDYLRGEPRSRIKGIVLTLLGAALATGVLIFVFDHNRALQMLGLRSETKPPEVAGLDPSIPKGSNDPNSPANDRDKPTIPSTPAIVKKQPENLAPPNDKMPGDKMIEPVKNVDLKVVTRPVTTDPSTAKSSVVPPPDATAKGPTPSSPPTIVPITVLPVPMGTGVRDPNTAPPNPMPSAVVPVPVLVDKGHADPKVGSTPAVPGSADKKGPDQLASSDTKLPGVGPAGNVPPAAPVTVGRFLSTDRQVLLRAGAKEDVWERVPIGAQLHRGDRLLVLPCFRPRISLAGLSLELDGGTQIELGSVSPAGVADIQVDFGRVIVQTLADPTARLHVRLGDIAGTLSFSDADSMLALEVRPMRSLGTDPEQTASPRQAVLYAATGQVRWAPDTAPGGAPSDKMAGAADESATITARHRKTLCGASAGLEDRAVPMPSWIASADTTALEQRASQGVEKALSPERSTKLTLIEQAAAQRVEVRNLATRSCAYIGYFEPLIKGLTDEDQRAGWMVYVAELRDAAARDQRSAAGIRATFEQLRRDQAPEMYRMLWGYTPAGLAAGDARRLVAYLDNDNLDLRVLGFWNLQDITGMGLNYRPEYSAMKRRPSVVRWQKRLDERKIVPSSSATPPAPAADKSAPAKGGSGT